MTDQELHTMIGQIGGELLARKWLLATAESCTGGRIATVLTDVAGSSQWFAGGLVTYSNAWKQQLLGVQEQTLAQFGAVSSQTVQEMLLGLSSRLQVQVGLAASGIAGPGGATPGKPVGTVFLGLFIAGHIETQCCHFSGDRSQIRSNCVETALQLLWQSLQNL